MRTLTQKRPFTRPAPAIAREALRSSGQPLDQTTRRHFESRLGHDFSQVRVHADRRAAESSDALHARAFTVGADVVFGAGEYAPGTTDGRRLLAHELTHVVQQSRSGDVRIQRKGKEGPLWTADELKKMLDTCDGGVGVWAKAKKANKDKDPKITPGTAAWTDTATGEISLVKTEEKCVAVQQLVHELSNLSRIADIQKILDAAAAGDVGRDDFIRRIERIEYETGVKNVLTAFDACKVKWSCTTAGIMDWARKAKDFEDYFTNFLYASHKEPYGQAWDNMYKAAYETKHPKTTK